MSTQKTQVGEALKLMRARIKSEKEDDPDKKEVKEFDIKKAAELMSQARKQ